MYVGAYSLIDQYLVHPAPMTGSQLALVIAGLVVILAFELWMLVDVLSLRKVPPQSRLWWIILMFLIQPIVAIAYFIVRSRYKPVR